MSSKNKQPIKQYSRLAWQYTKWRIISEMVLTPINVFIWVFKGISEELLFSNIIKIIFGGPQMTDISTLSAILRLITGTLLLMIMLGLALSIYFNVHDKKTRLELGKKAIPLIAKVRRSFDKYTKEIGNIAEQVRLYPVNNYAIDYLKNDADYCSLLEKGTTKTDATISVLSHLKLNPHFRQMMNSSTLPKLREDMEHDLVRLRFLEPNKKRAKFVTECTKLIWEHLDLFIHATNVEIGRELFDRHYSSISTQDRQRLYSVDMDERKEIGTNRASIFNFFDTLEDLWEVM